MKKSNRLGQLISLLAGILLCVPVSAFQLETLDGQRDNLMQYVVDGRWTLVFLWSTDCIPCEEQKPMIQAFHSKYADNTAAVVGLVLDGHDHMAEIEKVMSRHKPSYPNLVVFTDVFSQQFNELTGKEFRVTPTYLLFQPDGTLAGVHTGPISEEALVAVVTKE